MTTFKRMSPGLTVPELLRQQADWRAVQSCRALPAAAWCRSGMIAVALDRSGHRGLFGRHPNRPAARVPTDQTAACEPSVFTGLRGSALQAGIAACFAAAAGVLAFARLLVWCRLLSSDDVVLAFRSAEWLTDAGMRLWHTRGGRARGRRAAHRDFG